ncbi:MAG: sigma-54-dependent Fis family transcriptional regulator [Bdellovibrionales bacterium CG10_big_fil_rev_8_21_14_0_10_45_34]|nr:MAG: sigma-54-dependent Fis family transcriptional regulator [Bdellovibrionales bacterium CG10_big_fil_rev_8_21_14_0_10_45_34]
MLRLLVVDDDASIPESIRLLVPDGWLVVSCDPSKNPLPNPCGFDAAIVDMHLTAQQGAEGIQVIRKLLSQNPAMAVLGASGDSSIDLMSKAISVGAQWFLAKPVNANELLSRLRFIESYLKLLRYTDNNRWIGRSPVSLNILREIALCSIDTRPTLIQGESGAGKEVAASLIRKLLEPKPWISVNIAAIPDNLFESELFGHAKGAFTGADQARIGLIEAARNGTIFLDEIETLSLQNQAKLLRFLETGEVRRVGSSAITSIECRVVVASNIDLKTLVSEGRFREDLYWRLYGSVINIPSLRERKPDILETATFFLSRNKYGESKVITAEAADFLEGHTWPGNVRELRQVMDSLARTSPLPFIRKVDVEASLQKFSSASNSSTCDQSSPGSQIESSDIELSEGYERLISKFELSLFQKALATHQGVDEAARTLGMSRSNLYKKLKRYSLLT